LAKNQASGQCKLCRSHLRMDIETQRLLNAMSYRDLEDYCKDRDLNISYGAIKRHMDDHVDKKREVQVKYLATQRSGNTVDGENEEVSTKLKELINIDMAIREATQLMSMASQEIKRQLNVKLQRVHVVKDDQGKVTGDKVIYDTVNVQHSIVQLFKGATEEIRQCAKSKMDILGFDKKSGNKKDDALDTIVDAINRLDEE
jgi:hypothetical protein